MPYVTSIERRGIEKGREEGREEGTRRGSNTIDSTIAGATGNDYDPTTRRTSRTTGYSAKGSG